MKITGYTVNQFVAFFKNRKSPLWSKKNRGLVFQASSFFFFISSFFISFQGYCEPLILPDRPCPFPGSCIAKAECDKPTDGTCKCNAGTFTVGIFGRLNTSNYDTNHIVLKDFFFGGGGNWLYYVYKFDNHSFSFMILIFHMVYDELCVITICNELITFFNIHTFTRKLLFNYFN